MLDRVVRSFQLSFETLHTLRFSETTRNFLDVVNFFAGFVGIHNIGKSHYFQNHQVSEPYKGYPEWQQQAFKIADSLSNLSLILGGLKSGPSIAVWHWSVQSILSPQQLEQLFGRQGILPGETAYRSLAFLSFILGIPSTLKTTYLIYRWINKPDHKPHEEEVENTPPHVTPLPIRKEDVFVTMKTVSETARRFLRSPSKIA